MNQLMKFQILFQKGIGNKFHNPKNIAMSISIEAGELLECLQWDSPTASDIISDGKRFNELADEIADVQIYLLRMCSMLEIDQLKIQEENFH